MGLDKFSNIALRIMSGIIIGSLFIGSILFVPELFFCLVILIAAGMLLEWEAMTRSSFSYLLLGVIIASVPNISLILISLNPNNKFILLLYFITLWSIDTFAMIGGKTFGGPKLAPKLSPNKTWSGLIIGVLAAGILPVIVANIPDVQVPIKYFADNLHLSLGCMFLAVIAQISDLFISYFKRKFGVKDSGSLIPGHGGILDRFDSIIFTAPILLVVCRLS